MELVSDQMAARIAANGFPEGGYRICRADGKAQKVTLEEIQSWPQLKPPDCKICKGRCELITIEELERIRI